MARTSISGDDREVLRSLPSVRTTKLRLTYQAADTIHLPSPPAAPWRGMLGRILRRLAPEEEHERDQSLYQRFFRTPRTAVTLPEGVDDRALGALGLAGKHVPSPFVLRLGSPPKPATSTTLEPGETVVVEMILVEGAVRHVPTLAAAFEELERHGIGRKVQQSDGDVRRGCATLEAASLAIGLVSLSLYDGSEWSLPSEIGPSFYESAAALAPDEDDSSCGTYSRLLIDLDSPLRLKHRGSIVRPDDLSLNAFSANVYRRRLGLAACYGSEAPTPGGLQRKREAFFALADATTLNTSGIGWADDTRYSARQDQRHPTGGLVGSLMIHGPAPTWQSVLQPLQRLHLGKKTTLGLGCLTLDPGANQLD